MAETDQLSELPTGPGEPLARAELGLVAVSLALGIFLLVFLAVTLPDPSSISKGATKTIANPTGK